MTIGAVYLLGRKDPAMGTTRFDIEKFTEKADFGLWKLKMRALLMQQRLSDALKKKEELPAPAEGEILSLKKLTTLSYCA